MEIIIQSDAEAASKLCARYIARLVRRKPNAVLGLATGSTPLRLYAELIRLHREEGLDFSQVRTFNLDEYVGLGPDHPASYAYFMRKNLFDHINVPPGNVHIPSGTVPGEETEAYCERYEEEIRRAGGIDLQVLGIGGDGHIGFNEPASSLASRTRIKTLTARTRADNAPFFDSPDQVPHHVLTMGIGTILDAREAILLAFGEGKAAAVAASVEGPVSASVPASSLQLHCHARFLLDEASASRLTRQEYYRWVFDHKPAWQAV
jgi:glucosamine-6-phosphate deaminase